MRWTSCFLAASEVFVTGGMLLAGSWGCGAGIEAVTGETLGLHVLAPLERECGGVGLCYYILLPRPTHAHVHASSLGQRVKLKPRAHLLPFFYYRGLPYDAADFIS
jgi:hypothetical protein